jgi:hypothetical protein
MFAIPLRQYTIIRTASAVLVTILLLAVQVAETWAADISTTSTIGSKTITAISSTASGRACAEGLFRQKEDPPGACTLTIRPIPPEATASVLGASATANAVFHGNAKGLQIEAFAGRTGTGPSVFGFAHARVKDPLTFQVEQETFNLDLLRLDD